MTSKRTKWRECFMKCQQITRGEGEFSERRSSLLSHAKKFDSETFEIVARCSVWPEL